MNRTVVVGVGGAFALAAMMLSTTSGQTQTQTNTQTAVQGQTQSTSDKLHFIWNLSFRLSGGLIERFVERWQPEYQFQYSRCAYQYDSEDHERAERLCPRSCGGG